MIRSIHQFYGNQLGAFDGEIGRIKDFYFDDEGWAIRYVIAETGKWIPDRQVLLSPHAFGNLYQDGNALLVDLTRQQIADCPSIETHLPVSRQYEEEYFRYYGWPNYWDGAAVCGQFGPLAAPPPLLQPLSARSEAKSEDDPHLRSTKALLGYHLQTDEGAIGHIVDFLMDDQTWLIVQLVVETGHWFSGKKVIISPGHVDRISYEDSTVFVDISKQAIQHAPDYQAPPLEAAYHDSHGFDD